MAQYSGIEEFLNCLTSEQLDEYFFALEQSNRESTDLENFDGSESDISDESSDSSDSLDPEKDWDQFIVWLQSKNLDIHCIPPAKISLYFDNYIFPDKFNKECRFSNQCHDKHCLFQHPENVPKPAKLCRFGVTCNRKSTCKFVH